MVWVKPLADRALSNRDIWERLHPSVRGLIRLGCRAKVLGDVEVRTKPGGPPILQTTEWAPDPRPSRWKDRLTEKDTEAPAAKPAGAAAPAASAPAAAAPKAGPPVAAATKTTADSATQAAQPVGAVPKAPAATAAPPAAAPSASTPPKTTAAPPPAAAPSASTPPKTTPAPAKDPLAPVSGEIRGKSTPEPPSGS